MTELPRLARRIALVMLLASAGALRPAPALALTPAWTKLAPPGSVGLHVRDARRDREILFDETGLFAMPDVATPVWQRLWLGAPPVDAGNGYAFYDVARDRIWAMHSTFSDTMKLWSMDLSDGVLHWTASPLSFATPGMADTTVQYAMFAFDPVRDRLVMFGGYAAPPVGGAGASAAVFTLSLAGTPQWAHANVSGGSPPPRFSGAMVYEPWRDRMLAFGGVSYGPVWYDDTWALSLGATMSWTYLTPTVPPPPGRSPWSTVLDSLGRRWFSVGIGPVGGAGGGSTWWLDLSPGVPAHVAVWTEVNPGTTDPEPPAYPAVFEQRAQSRFLCWDGVAPWSLSLGPPFAWSKVWSDSIGLVRGKSLVTFVDPVLDRVYAGLGADEHLEYRALGSEGPWATIPATGPGPRYGAVAAVDPAARRALVFGGSSEYYSSGLDGDENNQLWAFGLDGANWTLLPPTPFSQPLPRSDALGVFDTAHRRLIVHGGRFTNPIAYALDDTWIYDAGAGMWSLHSSGDFPGAWGEIGVYDARRDRVVAWLSGSDVRVLPLGATVGTWSTLPATGTPPVFGYNGSALDITTLRAVYDSLGDRMLVTGGVWPRVRIWQLALAGTPAWSELAPSQVPPVGRLAASLVLDAVRQRVLMVGGTQPYSGDAGDTWALAFDETTPAEVALASADASRDGVTLRWFSPRPIAATVARREGAEAWLALGRVAGDGSGLVTWQDRAVRPGATYDYRLELDEGGATRFAGEVRITVPARDGFALEGARPNPADRPLRVRFSLASGAPATLELCDVAGRRVAAREVGGLGAGAHVARFDEGRPLAPGLYFLRLRQEGREARSRVVVTR